MFDTTASHYIDHSCKLHIERTPLSRSFKEYGYPRPSHLQMVHVSILFSSLEVLDGLYIYIPMRVQPCRIIAKSWVYIHLLSNDPYQPHHKCPTSTSPQTSHALFFLKIMTIVPLYPPSKVPIPHTSQT